MNQWSNLSAGDWISKPDKIDWSAQLNKADLGTSFSEDDVRVCVDSSRSQKSVSRIARNQQSTRFPDFLRGIENST